MQDENPRATSELSFKAQKPAGVLLSCIPRKHSCQDGAWQGGWAARRDTASLCQPHGSSTLLRRQRLFPHSPRGQKDFRATPVALWPPQRSDTAESPPKHRRSPALELPAGRTRSSTKPPWAVTPAQVRLRRCGGGFNPLETRFCQPGGADTRAGARQGSDISLRSPGEPRARITSDAKGFGGTQQGHGGVTPLTGGRRVTTDPNEQP